VSPAGTSRATSSAETAKLAASMARTCSAPSTDTRTPARGAPRTRAPRSTASNTPTARSIGTPATDAASGNRAVRATCPGVSNSPLTSTKPSSPHSGNPVVWSSTGTASTATAPTRSASTLARRCPSRSMTGPPNVPPSTTGTVAATPVNPVSVADPVLPST